MLSQTPRLKVSLALVPILLLASCATQPTQPPAPPPKPAPTAPQVIVNTPPPVVIIKKQPVNVVPRPAPMPIPQPQAHYNSFEDWKADFAMRAIAQGVNAYEVRQLLDKAQLNPQVFSLDGSQPEFAKMPWEYADSAVSSGRVSNGQRNFAEQQYLLNRLQAQYGVNAEIIAAIWGMESSYGAGTGTSYIPSSLGSLAYDGRRRDWAEEQLLALLQLIQRGDVYPSQLDGSWAGGMGQTQFIPKTWLDEGVDGDGDGHRNPWATADALSSTASYLKNAGWIRGLSPFYEVRLPASFNYTYVGNKLSGAQWRSLGVTMLDGGYLDAGTPFELWLPAGKEGPALLLSPNFDAIKVYNNASSYALGVSLLGRALAGQSGLQTAWPRYEQPLSSMQVTNLQQRLTTAGYDTKGVDGVLGTNTRQAFAKWQAANGQTPDGFITQRSAASLIW